MIKRLFACIVVVLSLFAAADLYARLTVEPIVEEGTITRAMVEALAVDAQAKHRAGDVEGVMRNYSREAVLKVEGTLDGEPVSVEYDYHSYKRSIARRYKHKTTETDDKLESKITIVSQTRARRDFVSHSVSRIPTVGVLTKQMSGTSYIRMESGVPKIYRVTQEIVGTLEKTSD